MPLFINNKQQCLSTLQQLQIDSFNFISPILSSLIDKADEAEGLGKDKLGTKYWDTANDLMYLNIYLMIVKNRIIADISKGEYNDYAYYDNIFSLNCIIKTFACNGIDIKPLYALYELVLDPNYDGGIEYMILQNNVGEEPPFLIY